jgi:xanthosine utilization system XapX-like protein
MVEIVVALIGLLGIIVSAVVMPYLREKTTAEQVKTAQFWVNAAVLAAEQVFKNPSGTGAVKKQYVLKFLDNHGIKLGEAELDTLIEAAVKELKSLTGGVENG